MKKGFTIAETIITVVILGVIAAVAIPTFNNAQPNKDVAMYKKALYLMNNAVVQVVDSAFDIAMNEGVSSYNPEIFLKNLPASTVCIELANRLKTVGPINCNQEASQTSFDSPDFTTVDGLKFWGIGGTEEFTGTNGDDIDWIYVDYELTNKDRARRAKESGDNTWLDSGKHGLIIAIRADGKVYTPAPGSNNEFNYENKLIRDSLKLKVDEKTLGDNIEQNNTQE